MAHLYARRKQIHQYKETARKDPYRSQSKARGTPRCPSCLAVSVRGRWLSAAQLKMQHDSKKSHALITGELKCPACNQLDDHFALGVIEIHGEDWRKNLDLIIQTIQNTEKIARLRNDQERILWTKNDGDVAKIYVTLPELARSIGRELEKSFQGVTEYVHSSEEPYIRVRWWPNRFRGHGAEFAK